MRYLEKSFYKKIFYNLKNDGFNFYFRSFKHFFINKRKRNQVDETKVAFEALKANTFKGLMIDVGAHFGSSLAPFADCGWTVFAFEPDSNNRKRLLSSFNDFKNVVIDKRAISSTPQTAATLFTSSESTGISGLSAFHPSHKPGEKIDVTTLELFFIENDVNTQTLDFLKIDTEGFDLHVLRGIPWDKISPRLILCEFEDAKTIPIGYTFHDLAIYLKKKGYKLIVSEWYPIRKYGESHEWKRFNTYPCELDDPRGWGNILATNDDFLYNSLLHICKILND
jgi:FkbM family methyltransferase